MRTEVAILHHEYPAHVRQHVEDKLRDLGRFNERTLGLRALLERDHDKHRVELIATLRRGIVKVVDARGESFQSALDDALHRMGRILTRHKEVLTNNRRHPRHA